MSLLSKADRKTRFKFLGLGAYNAANIKKFQKKAFPKLKNEWDGIYGEKTDNALRHFYNVKKKTKNFEPEEFRCPCGRCTGYPTFMKQNELAHLQRIRDHFKVPMTVTSGLRCEYENKKVGGDSDSGHLKGKACDFYAKSVTDTVPNRNIALVWIKKQPNHKFTYGANMVGSDGIYRSAPNMGNVMHTEVK